jgi:hypothetical protein
LLCSGLLSPALFQPGQPQGASSAIRRLHGQLGSDVWPMRTNWRQSGDLFAPALDQKKQPDGEQNSGDDPD